MWLNFVLLLLVLRRINFGQATDEQFLNKIPLWSWECINEKCVPLKPEKVLKLQSLETCSMLCASMQIWPHPTGHVSLSTTAVPVRADLFHLNLMSFPSRIVGEHLRDAFELFQQDLHTMEDEARGFEEWRKVIVRVFINGTADPRMRLDTDESYRLSLKPIKRSLYADIAASSFCGARHAFETLSQLVWLDPYAGSLLILEAATIDDNPKFSYRGLLVDTARNYFRMEELMHTIDAMAMSKLNTFHWHVSDSQAFSLQLHSLPELSEYGAYSASDIYLPEEVRALVKHARLRGIRVVIEVDLPAHIGLAWTWGQRAGVGNLSVCDEEEPWSIYCGEPPCGQLNPLNRHLYDLISRIYGEIILMTSVDDIFHLGGSDVNERCWEKHINHINAMDLWIGYTKAVFQHLTIIAGKMPKLTLLWSSRLNDVLKTDFKEFTEYLGLQVRNKEWAQKFVAGIRTVISHEDVWDLNCGMGAWYEETGGTQYNSWQRIYEHRPWFKSGGSIVIGGEATVWSHTIDEGSLDSHIWPRGAAFAERVWADRAEGASKPVYARLDFHRLRLVSRGIQAAPLWTMWCTQNTYTCM